MTRIGHSVNGTCAAHCPAFGDLLTSIAFDSTTGAATLENQTDHRRYICVSSPVFCPIAAFNGSGLFQYEIFCGFTDVLRFIRHRGVSIVRYLDHNLHAPWCRLQSVKWLLI